MGYNFDIETKEEYGLAYDEAQLENLESLEDLIELYHRRIDILDNILTEKENSLIKLDKQLDRFPKFIKWLFNIK